MSHLPYRSHTPLTPMSGTIPPPNIPQMLPRGFQGNIVDQYPLALGPETHPLSLDPTRPIPSSLLFRVESPNKTHKKHVRIARPDGLPHEKADPAIVKRLKNIFTPPVDHYGQQNLHIDNEDTTWFETARKNGKPVLQDYGRYSAIIAESNTGDFNYRYF
ncbi:hypothetical protein BS50DRAFT_593770 [Corynespora cassiicola Philippines]|uniref:Uncharacterized protein n=1 Tax=Corynespora cassiicola Philippines TaxID=1448308 RepID=A0A2T2N5G2_CORCC|nr:hypothetical protein BS50DRAFT_593770 [Corynespora cassiicola Philippines]